MRQIRKSKYTVAIIGCGKVGVLYESEAHRPKPASHAGYVVTNPRTSLVAFVDTSLPALKKASKLFPKVSTYIAVRDCLKIEHPDIVIIATPPSARLALVRECIRYGVKAIICEKPMASSTVEATAIARAVKKSGIIFVLNYPRRFAPLFLRVRRAIKSGTLGRVQQVTCYYSNGLYNNGGHLIDALMFLFGETLSVVWARRVTRGAHPTGDPCVDAILETAQGVQIHLQSVDQNAYGIFDIRVLGTRGERVLTDYSSTLIEISAKASSFKEVRQLDRAGARIVQGREGSALSEALVALGRRRSSDGAEQGLIVMRILDAIHHEAKKK